MSFIGTGLREIGLKVRRQRTRIALRHQKRVLQRSEINLGREGCSEASSFPEVRNEIVALKKLEQEQKEVTVRIAQIEESLRRLEGQRQENTKQQNAVVGKLEEEQKPLVLRRDEAKAAANLCERELATVERRIQENDASDRALLKKLSDLHALVPPPPDLESQSVAINAQRVRLPEERAELLRARTGTAEACRSAREKLSGHESEVAVAEREIARVRGEWEARDRAINENSRAQQDALRDARAQHQTVEERKNPAYLNIGRHLATYGIAPPNAPHLLSDVLKHREMVQRHSEHRAHLAVLSSQIDKQELRKFYFALLSVLVLLAIILPLVFQSPAKREWLPQETENILSLNTERFDGGDLAQQWRKEQPDDWQKTRAGLAGVSQYTPVRNPARDVLRITRAMMVPETGGVREFVLVETRGEVSQFVQAIEKDRAFERRPVNGLPVWIGPQFALARVGPRTLAIGAEGEVEELARVRLGIKPDLKITGPLFERFQALDRDSALRVISRDPKSLPRVFHPIFNRELLESTELLGVALNLDKPVHARLLMRTKSPETARMLAHGFRAEPQRWLALQESNLMLYAQPPEIEQDGANVEVRFDVPENSARLLLQRVGKTDAPLATAAN
ncbi:MAG: hypothetical protein ABI871_05830 [Chthoniobacterales bacterium]